jgi:spore maturation protein CgeB
MKILYVSGLNRMVLFNKLIPKALQSLGYEVSLFDWNAVFKFNKVLNVLPRKKVIKEINERLLEKAKSEKPDFVFVLKGEPLYKETLKSIKEETGAVLFNWFGDDPWEFPVFSGPVSVYYDFFFTYDPYSVNLYRRAGHKGAFHLPYAYDAELGASITLTEKERKKYSCDVAFIGSLYPKREELLSEIIDDYDLKIWGRGWKNSKCEKAYQGKALYGVEMLKAMKASRILLNIHKGFGEGVERSGEGLNLRVMEGAAVAAFQLSNFQADIPNRFVPDKEIVLYENWEEAKEKIKHFLGKTGERKDIGTAAFERLKNEHTLKQRFQEMFEIIQKNR